MDTEEDNEVEVKQGRDLTDRDYEILHQLVPQDQLAGNVISSAEHWFEDQKKSGSPIACCSVLDIIELNPPYDYRKRRKLLDDLIHE